MDLLERLFDGSFMPHGHCLLWREDLLFLHIAGDILTAISYAVIPLVLIYLVRKRSDLVFNWIFMMFAAFIFLCGVTHIISLVNIWHGYYFIEGIAKLSTGLVSVLTAYMAWKLVPKALAVPSNDQFRIKNEQLLEVQQELQQSNQLLEQRVHDRTQELEVLAQTDALTGALNRGGLMARLSMEIDRASRYKHGLSVLMVDLDHFKLINDEHGHQVGDTVLTEAVAILSKLCRSSDCLGRYGGEEFLILLPETIADRACEFAERIRLEIEQHRFCEETPLGITMTCSIGVTEFQPNQSKASLLQQVDHMLYSAKDSGRNRVVVANSNEAVMSSDS